LDKGSASALIVIGVQLIVSLGFVLSWFHAPSWDAAVVFAIVTMISAVPLLVFYFARPNVPFPFAQNIQGGFSVAGPAIAAAVFAVYGFAVFFAQAMPAASVLSVLPEPVTDFGVMVGQALFGVKITGAVPVGSSLDWAGFTSTMQSVLWNFEIASSEEGFRVTSTNILSIGLIKFHLPQKWSVLSSGIFLNFVWVYYHTFQSINTENGLFMAFMAGLVFFALNWYFKNYVPATITHTIWDIIAPSLQH
jgi:hypothetical protein